MWGSMIFKVTRLWSGQFRVQMPTGARNSSCPDRLCGLSSSL